MDNKHLLIVDDHQEIRELLQRFLKQHQYRVSVAINGQEMKKKLKTAQIDLIILDLMLPGEDGLTLCRNLRAQSNIPVIMLSAMGEEMDKIIGLEMGADDYISKPFNPHELLARIKAVLRRSTQITKQVTDSQILHFERWTLDINRRQLLNHQGINIILSSAEFSLLKVFLEHPQQVLSRDQLLDLAKGREGDVYDRAIDTQVSRLRKKLEKDPKQPCLIKTIWGGGYQLACEVENAKTSRTK
ncbi:winged helix family two component transcriptional regulator [Psychromonas sp. CNPT3]|uniref:response regulator n=1 Tax=Psychromonas sp. CNPT3 TaxID=314282 RepID=UPI00006E9EA4|nr:response regulator [Psychromonas sp. CNPT3]AGH82187.1 winged helix family two component transcriptional regulator [Psychromonas sp. CNPT3]